MSFGNPLVDDFLTWDRARQVHLTNELYDLAGSSEVPEPARGWLYKVASELSDPSKLRAKKTPPPGFQPAQWAVVGGIVKRLADGVGSPAEPPVDPPDVLGRWAFGSSRRDLDEPLEPDNPLETQLHIALARYVNDKRPVSAAVGRQLADIVGAGKYTRVIRPPPPGTRLYRGMGAGVEPLQLFGEESDDDLAAGGGVIERALTYTPKDGVGSSWTTDRQVAESFAEDHPVRYAVVVEAETSGGTFLMGPNGFYKLRMVGRDYTNEREVLGIGPVKCKRAAWWQKKGGAKPAYLRRCTRCGIC